MTTNNRASDRGSSKQFLVTCEGCSFERTAIGRDDARRTGSDHRRETGHELVALELPATTESA